MVVAVLQCAGIGYTVGVRSNVAGVTSIAVVGLVELGWAVLTLGTIPRVFAVANASTEAATERRSGRGSTVAVFRVGAHLGV